MSYSSGFTISQLAHFLVAIIGLAGALSCNSSPSVRASGSTIQGQVLDARGRPASQYPVKIEQAEGSPETAVAFTDFTGTFQFVNLPPGKYKLYPLNRGGNEPLVVELGSDEVKIVGALILPQEIKVELNKEAALTINADAAKTINPDAALTLNPEAAKTLNGEAAKTINPEAARTINKEAAATINAEAARLINPEAASVINRDAARVLNPQRALVLTKDEAMRLTPAEAMKAPLMKVPAAN